MRVTIEEFRRISENRVRFHQKHPDGLIVLPLPGRNIIRAAVFTHWHDARPVAIAFAPGTDGPARLLAIGRALGGLPGEHGAAGHEGRMRP